MAYTPVENRLGIQPIGVSNIPLNTSGFQAPQIGQSPFFGKEHPLGTIIRAYDPVFGEGEFIYLQLVSGQTVGHAVTWGGFGTVNGDGTLLEAQYQAALVPTTASANQDLPIAIAMSGFPIAVGGILNPTAFGWFQISGHAVIFTNGTAAVNSPPNIYQSGTAGLLTSTATASTQIQNARLVAALGTPATVNVASATVAAGGTGYVTGQVVNAVGGTGVLAQAQFTITAAAGVITGLAVLEAGAYTALPTSPVTLAGGNATGTGGTATLTSQAPYATAYIDRPYLQGRIT